MAANERVEPKEDPVDPNRRIVDPHHHLYDRPGNRYLVNELLADTRAGHNVTHTVFIECSAFYRDSGPEALRPVGETEFVASQARETDRRDSSRLAGIVGYTDLSAGDVLDEVLQAHAAAGDGRFRGIRHGTAWDDEGKLHSREPKDLMTHPGFRRGVARLGELGFSFDAWLYHPQLGQLADVASAAEGTTIVVNHLGMPLYVKSPGAREPIRTPWRQGMRLLAERRNVVVKLGGIGMDFGFGTDWSSRERAPGSDEVAAWWSDDIRFAIDTFGPSRCMFESNFPVDRAAFGYTVLWNVFQKIAAGYSDVEQDELFSGTAARVYRIT
jgi:predicted TIM-barrel fold metal-dependent hydrolase